ncbi:leucine-rich repeat-containing protein 59 [Planococcus citri]|uniref:leucine-rich repeat-containing protein 59 n=1 Tax=Planococcus citri TaxID=170843 RepID=UPI0031F7C647
MVANLKDRIKNGELNLSSCGLKEIPLKEIAGLKHVISLNLSNNKIASIPKGLGTVTHLQRIDLSKNQIKGLPDGIGNLTNLKYFNLSKNQLATLPATFGNLRSLKHLDVSNNPLAQKFSELVGPCQTESQCQQAAKNILKALSSQSDTDKKKKQKEAEQESKKKKNDKKAQNGGIATQTKQKDRKQKKPSKGFFGKLVDWISFMFKVNLFIVFVTIAALYTLSFVNEPYYRSLKSQAYPVFHSALTRVLSEDSTVKVEAILKQTETTVNTTVITGAKFVSAQSQRFYTYVTTDPTIQRYISSAKTSINDLYNKIKSAGGGEQKS